MNSKKIEMNSINKLKTELERCEKISTMIPDNDRTPSWDGEIFLYNTNNLEKEHIRGVIRVQVKGKKVEKGKLRNREISYPIEVADLRNFRSVGGTILFVVCMEDYDHYKIYYNSLLPLDLEEFLKNIGVNQKKKSIRLTEFATDNLMMTLVLSNFIKDSKKQHSNAKSGYVFDARIAEYDSFVFSTINPQEGFSDDMFKIPTYIYGRKNGFDIDIPLTKVVIESMNVNNVEMKVEIDGVIFYEQVSVEKRCDNTIIKIGAGFTIDVNKENFNYHEKGNLKERIQDLKFFLGMVKGNVLKIGNVFTAKDIIMEGYNLKEIEEELEFYNSIQKLMHRLNIIEELDLDIVDANEFEELAVLQEAIMNELPVRFEGKNEKLFWAKYRIANLVIAILAEKTDNGKYIIKNVFDEIRQCIMKNDKMEEIPSCIYIMLRKKDFIELSNVCYENMLKALLSVPYGREYGVAVNLLLLEMLSAFDEKAESDLKLINNVITIAKWLTCQENDNYLFVLNYLQAIRRTRILNKEESEILYKMREDEIRNDYNLSVLLGISILLENKADFAYYFEKMKPEEKESFIKFPIYTLTKKIK